VSADFVAFCLLCFADPLVVYAVYFLFKKKEAAAVQSQAAGATPASTNAVSTEVVASV
jgi:hypothetical protein